MSPTIHATELADEFSARTWARGRRYFETGRVRDVSGDASGWEAQVQGTRRSPYSVWIVVVEEDGQAWLDGACSCPLTILCKHMAALLLAARAAHRDGAGTDPSEPERGPSLTEAADLREWVAQLERVRESPPTRPVTGASPAAQLIYVLLLQGPGRATVSDLMVETWTARRLKRGGLGKCRRYTLGDAFGVSSRTPAYVTNADRLLWFRLTQLGGAYSAFSRDSEGTALFRDLVATGRCYFANAKGLALRYGSARSARVVWELDGTGRQRARVHTAESRVEVVLPLDPPHYLDPVSGETGPLTLDLPREIAATIVDLPSLAPRTAAAIPKELARVLDDAGLARPAAFAVRTVDPASIQPVLTLSVDSELAPGAEGFDNARAKVRFDYGPVSVDLDDRYARTSALIACVVDDQLHEVTRDIKREEQWLLELRALGFGPSRNVVFGELCLPSAADWIDLCHHEIDALRGRGWQVELDPEFPFELLIGEDWYVDLETSDTEWFTLELGVEIDGERVNLLPVVVDAIRRGEIVRERIRVETKAARLPLGDGRWVSLDSRRLSKILDVLVELFDDRLDDGRLKLARADSSRLLALVGLKWHGDKGLRKLAEQLAQRSALPRVKTPRALRAQLRDYQARGLDWLGFLRAHDFGGILADDMGLGKTIQTLAHLLVEKRARRLDRPCLVVAPRSVITNWARECERFSPSLSCAIFHGPERGRLFEAELPNVVITTYALLQRDSRLREQAWHVVILDEAQAIKNPRTKLAAAARELSARQRLCLTGTPMENNLEELWSLFTFIAPGLLGSVGAFSRHYRRPIEKGGDAGRMAALSARIAPFMLRRTKEQVLTELPPKTETVVTVSFEPRQRDLYESVRMTMEKRVREALDARGLAKSHIIVLDALLKLRQVCCHPALVKNDTARRSKAGSAKTERLVELLTELVAQGRQTIIFSQFTSMLDIVGHEIDNLGVEHRRITGKTTKRQRIVDAFQAGEFPVLMISLKAGGTGINLTAADTVIHYDPWWNPAVEDQATSRAHRIGQDKPVTVYRLVCEGTVEQRVLALQDRKRELSSAITRGAEQRSIGGLKLAPEDLDLLFSPLDA